MNYHQEAPLVAPEHGPRDFGSHVDNSFNRNKKPIPRRDGGYNWATRGFVHEGESPPPFKAV